MKLSTTARYGLRAVTELALQGAWKGSGGRPLSLSAVAKRQGISVQYLRQILLPLKRARIAVPVMGRSGGYLLARPPEKITVLEVISALGEQIEPVFCVRKPSGCRRVRECPTHPLWARLADMMREALTVTTVAQLARRCPRRGAESMSRGYAFHI
jgi:Rrf2 family protein